MQNKGVIKFFAIALTLVCLFYLSFSFGTSKAEKQIEEVRKTQGSEAAEHLKDSLENSSVWFGFDLKKCRQMQIGLGLDLKGGMNMTMQLSLPDVVTSLANRSQDPVFKQAVEEAHAESQASGVDFLDLFIAKFQASGKKLSTVFANTKLRDKVLPTSTDDEVIAVLRQEVQDAVDNMQHVLRTRIDRFGVAQPNIQVLTNKVGCVMVEMPGVTNVDEIRSLLQSSANLEFWLTFDNGEAVSLLSQLADELEREREAEKSVEAEAEDTAEATAEPAAATEAEGEGHPNLSEAITASTQAEEEAPVADTNVLGGLRLAYNYPNGVVGLATKADMNRIDQVFAGATARSFLASNNMRLMWAVSPDKNGVYELYAIKVTTKNGSAPLEGDVVIEAKDEFDEHGNPCVGMKMNTQGAREWAKLTGANVGHSIAIVLDERVYSAPNVQNEISGGSSRISGNFTPEETRNLANVLKSGKMPARAFVIGQQVVGPSLGQESINQGVMSFAIGIVLLFIFMISIYGFRAGMVANSALLLNAFFTLGVLTSLQASLTMSGIAGLVLTLGMAVDANVLIYERTKEELRAGKRIKEAINAGYGNAFSAIFDSNLTSILTGVILFNFGTGPIRGFATTYIVGIIVSFFTAVFLTRLVYDNRMKHDKWQDLKFTTGFANKISFGNEHNFMGRYKTSLAIFGTLAVFSVVGWVVRGFGQSIDFTGGRTLTIQFEKQISPEAIRPLLDEIYPNSSSTAIAAATDGRTIRVQTNYKIEDESADADIEVTQNLFNTLKAHELLDANLTYELFMDPDERAGGTVLESQKVGPSIARDITQGAVVATILALVVIFAYIWIRFRNFSFSLGAITALFVDTLLILGAYAWCHGWMPFSLDIDQTFIGAILTAIGYSINDKVVVFDRIREFIHLYPKRDKQELFNTSLNTTLARTIWTSVSTLIVLVVIFALGAASIRSFAFALILGVVIGTLTSIFVAAPVAFLTHGKKIKEEEKKVVA